MTSGTALEAGTLRFADMAVIRSGSVARVAVRVAMAGIGAGRPAIGMIAGRSSNGMTAGRATVGMLARRACPLSCALLLPVLRCKAADTLTDSMAAGRKCDLARLDLLDH